MITNNLKKVDSVGPGDRVNGAGSGWEKQGSKVMPSYLRNLLSHRQLLICFLSLWILFHFLELYMNGMQHVLFLPGFFHKIIFIFIPVVVYKNISFCF